MTWDEVNAIPGVWVHSEMFERGEATRERVVITDANMDGGRGRSFTGRSLAHALDLWRAARGRA